MSTIVNRYHNSRYLQIWAFTVIHPPCHQDSFFQKMRPSNSRRAVRNTVAAFKPPFSSNVAPTSKFPLACPIVIPVSSIRLALATSVTVLPGSRAADARANATVIGTALCGWPTERDRARRSIWLAVCYCSVARELLAGGDTRQILGTLPGTICSVWARPILTPAWRRMESSRSSRSG